MKKPKYQITRERRTEIIKSEEQENKGLNQTKNFRTESKVPENPTRKQKTSQKNNNNNNNKTKINKNKIRIIKIRTKN